MIPREPGDRVQTRQTARTLFLSPGWCAPGSLKP
ncbi:hypothetical protein ACVW1C_005805 [Bradyrhizobium sp. USDA 4011]